MYTYITNIAVSGIKNINKIVSLNFYGKTTGKEIKLQNNNIKAIYGPNGAGKSALIHALDIYDQMISRKGYLFSDNSRIQLDELINKDTNMFYISVTFLLYEEQKTIIGKFRHEMKIKKKDDYYIDEENLYQVLSKSEKVLAKVSEGEIVESLISNELKSKMSNQLLRRSIIDVYKDISLNNFKHNIQEKKEDSALYAFAKLGMSLFVKTEEIDKHEFYIFNKRISNNFKPNIEESRVTIDSFYSYRLDTRFLPEFKKHMKNMENFIKLFKRDLVQIELKEKIDKNEVVVEPYFDYGTYKVHLEFESAGIKKLTELFDLFTYKENGDIIVIDEFDSCINDVYLMKLLEYFVQNPKGQLIFTSHNITPMQVLSRCNHAIDFITEDGDITEWKKNGNYSPVKVYQNGLIKGLPFNINSFDFIGLFDEEN